MTDRHTVDSLTSDVLDRLYDRADNAEARLRLAREALIRDGYFTADEVGDDVAPRIVEWLAHHNGRVEKAEAALAACTAQLVHDQAALARLRQGLADVITDMHGTTGARHWIAALDSVLNPAHDGGPTVAEAKADDASHWNGKYDRP